ncbi:MAG TPA: DNA translocase FtsK, partial [Candidatus Akkermansia intestinigallinarum]|nr:DNA translocase FtsK [Candidatus Akkermansia intestinigallinarum]
LNDDDGSERLPLPAASRYTPHARPVAPQQQPRPAAPRPAAAAPQQPLRPAEPRPAAPSPISAATQPAALSTEDTREQYPDYPLPPYDLLTYRPVPPEVTEAAREEMYAMQQRICDTLETFKISVTPGPITRGPSITRYEFHPPKGLRVNRITALNRDLMLATSSKSVNILAPIPGKNTVGIELENSTKSPVYLRELLQDEAFRNPKIRIPVALGKDVYGNAVIGDLAAMPHTLVAGTTGSGKSVCINSMILSMLYRFRPDELKLILVDPKVVEMQPYKKLPHLICPVVTNPARVIGALRWAVNEMEHRYSLFSKIGVRNFTDFNNRAADYQPEPDEEDMQQDAVDFDPEVWASEIERQSEEGLPLPEETQEEIDFEENEPIPTRLPYIVIIIDELADLMQVVKEDLEAYIARLAQKARAAGIHLVVATQSPRSGVVTGIIKANIPSRIALKVSSPLDSRIILDSSGAENLLGKGDFLFLPPEGISKLTRAQGAFVSDDEIASIVKFCASHAKQKFEAGVTAEMDSCDGTATDGDNAGRLSGSRSGGDDEDELYTRCVQLVITERKASTSLLQRRFSIGYGRAAKIMDLMEARGVITPPQGATRAREVLIEAP